MQNNTFDNHEQFVISHDLVKLMQCIVKNNPEGLKKVIEVAISRENNIKAKNKNTTQDYQEILYNEYDLQDSLLNFFGLMEFYLHQGKDKTTEEKILQKSIIPAIRQVDTSLCDEILLNSCASIATAENKSQYNANETFLQEILKRWNPKKDNSNN